MYLIYKATPSPPFTPTTPPTISQPQSWENRVKFKTPSPPVGMVSQLLPGFEFRSLPLLKECPLKKDQQN